ncbi:MAG TPA: PfkB family carbohydrate kinase [Chloroflexia bacterium]|nr:PfkB family carbohydrate kinase [Chloroflexia bacterium]
MTGANPPADFDVLALGELLVEMVATRGGPLSAAPGFTRAPGGAAANVAAGVARLGRQAAFAGLVGDDPFGRYLVSALAGYGVDTRWVGFHPRGRTPVVFVSKDAADDTDGEGAAHGPHGTQLLVYREGGADQLFSPAAVPVRAVTGARIVVGSGVSLASALPRAALHAAIAQAEADGVTVAFDVHWQPARWQQPERARDLYHAVLPHVDILMLSATELIMLTGGAASSEEARLDAMLRAWVARLVGGRTRPLLVALTRGPAGCTYGLWRPGGTGFEVAHEAACDISVKDRTGAGDAFLAGLLVALLDHLAPLPARGEPTAAPEHLDLGNLTLADVADIFTWANASGALATTRRGTMAALPARNTVLRLIHGRRGS